MEADIVKKEVLDGRGSLLVHVTLYPHSETGTRKERQDRPNEFEASLSRCPMVYMGISTKSLPVL
jgi:hypothetical protein